VDRCPNVEPCSSESERWCRRLSWVELRFVAGKTPLAYTDPRGAAVPTHPKGEWSSKAPEASHFKFLVGAEHRVPEVPFRAHLQQPK
jgi:hypothetical protein